MTDNIVDFRRRRDPWENGPPAGQFDSDVVPSAAAYAATKGSKETLPPPRRLSDILDSSTLRVERRCNGIEKPIALPWPSLAPQFGGGLWPGLHFLNSGTGVGKTQFALQVALNAAKGDIPVLYVGLELGDFDLGVRMIGLESEVPWSTLWVGKAGPKYIERAQNALPALRELPFHFEVSRPHGFAPSLLLEAIEATRALYPETDGPGSRPMLVVVDFLQLIGDEAGSDLDLRIRIGRAAYVLRDVANRLSVAVLCVSSISRERYKLLNEIHLAAGLQWELDPNDCPIERQVKDSDAVVGTGKESGDIEFSADSISVLARVGATWDGKGSDAVLVTAKGRATGASWSPLRFTGFRYEECTDRGGRLIEAWAETTKKRERVREEKRLSKEDEKAARKMERVQADAEAIRSYVGANPGCSVRDARAVAVNNQHPRWSPALALLGEELVQTKAGTQLTLSLREVAQ